MLGELEQAAELADVGGGPFLHTLVEAVPTVANAGHYAQLVVESARRRRIIDLGIHAFHLYLGALFARNDISDGSNPRRYDWREGDALGA